MARWKDSGSLVLVADLAQEMSTAAMASARANIG